MSGDLGGHSSRGRSVSWIERPIQHRGRCSLRNLRTSWWKWAAELRLAVKWSRWFLPIAVRRVAPSAYPDTWSLSLCSPGGKKKKWSEDPCAWYGTKDIYFGRILFMFNDDVWGFSASRSEITAIHFPVKWNVLSSLNVRRFTPSLSFSMWLLILQQVQAVRVHHNPPPNAPDRDLRQALLRATSPCRFPGTSLEGDRHESDSLLPPTRVAAMFSLLYRYNLPPPSFYTSGKCS